MGAPFDNSQRNLAAALAAPASSATVQPYQQTVRDRLASALLRTIGDSYPQQRFTENLLGSSGLGQVKTGAVDFTPLGAMLMGDEGGRKAAMGNVLGGAADIGLAAIPLPAAVKGAKGLFRGAERAVAPEAERAIAPIVAYHGSPHKFDQFSLDKIGTGEGAQAYGHGLYFAENEAVAKGYRDGLTAKHLDDEWSDYAPSEAAAFRAIRNADGDKAKAVADLHANLGQATREWEHAKQHAPHIAPNMEGQVWKYEDAIQHVHDGIQPPGSMYQVGIHAPPEHFLDWDTPLSSQTPEVKRALEKVGIREGGAQERKQYLSALPNHLHATAEEMLAAPAEKLTDGSYDDAWARLMREAPDADHNAIHDIRRIQKQPEGWYAGMQDAPATGEDIYRSLRRDEHSYGPAGSAADALHQAGIPGIKYLDQGSRGAGNGTRNYVVFSPAIIDIMKRYGIAAPLAASILAAGVKPRGGGT